MLRLLAPPRQRPRGYTLVEAMVAMALTAMAGAVVLLTVETSIDASDQTLQRAVAAGLAEQLLDEVVGAMYCEPGGDPRQNPLGPSTWEKQGGGRERFREIGDFHGYQAQPPQDRRGFVVGAGDESSGSRHPSFCAPSGAFDNWRQRVEVYYVNAADPAVRLAGSQTSDYRAVEVFVERQLPGGQYLELARARRVVAALPTLP